MAPPLDATGRPDPTAAVNRVSFFLFHRAGRVGCRVGEKYGYGILSPVWAPRVTVVAVIHSALVINKAFSRLVPSGRVDLTN